jgi:hypothetical protein
MEIYESNRKGKRFAAVFSDGTITHFGLDAGTTFIDVGNTQIRKNYIARHKGLKEDWTNPKKAGTLSRFILWGDSTSLDKNIEEYIKRFNLS